MFWLKTLLWRPWSSMTQKLIACRTCWDHSIFIVPRRWKWEVWLTLKTFTIILQQVRISETSSAQKPQWWSSAANDIKVMVLRKLNFIFQTKEIVIYKSWEAQEALLLALLTLVLCYSAQTCPTEGRCISFYLGSTVWPIDSCKHSFRWVNINFSCSHY